MACLKGAAKEGRERGRLRLERSMNDLLVVILFLLEIWNSCFCTVLRFGTK